MHRCGIGHMTMGFTVVSHTTLLKTFQFEPALKQLVVSPLRCHLRFLEMTPWVHKQSFFRMYYSKLVNSRGVCTSILWNTQIQLSRHRSRCDSVYHCNQRLTGKIYTSLNSSSELDESFCFPKGEQCHHHELQNFHCILRHYYSLIILNLSC